MKRWIAVAIVCLALGAAALVPVGGGRVVARPTAPRAASMDLSQFSAEPPEQRLDLLFVHHSIGGQLLADPGPPTGEGSIHPTHPNGGGLRSRLSDAGYEVHEASYGSLVGEHTDLRHWLPKFRDQMDRVLRTRSQDALLDAGHRNDVVVFKSCYPNNLFVGEGSPPGDPTAEELTVANAKAALRALLPHFERHPDVLFVYVTAPPVAPRLRPDPAWKWLAKRVLRRGMTPDGLKRSAQLARELNDWAKSPGGWLQGYAGTNVVVFDYYDLLTEEGRSNLSAYPTGAGFDSHPSAEGNRRAAERFVPFLNRAVRRGGLSP